MGAPAISKATLGFFRYIVRGYFRRHFHGVRMSGELRDAGSGPLMIYANHGSWWDPMVCVLLAEKMMAGLTHYAPMDAEALEKYPILKRVGIFPVEMKTARGAVQFLRTGEQIVAGGGVLWVTPQGQFVDTRVRPLEFKPGLAALAARVAAKAGTCRVQPLAIEYLFWDERLPECLLHWGDAVVVQAGERAEAVEDRLKQALTVTMEELKQKALTRDAREFAMVTQGRLGMGGFYALGQRAKAALRGRRYEPEHTVTPLTAGRGGGRDA